MSLIRLQNVAKSYEDHPVLKEIYLRLSEGERTGLIGKNGFGKTTLLRLLLGQEQPDSGAVEINDGVRIGYFSQFSTLEGHRTIQEVLLDLFAGVRALEDALLAVELALESQPNPAEMDRLLEKQADLLAEMERQDGCSYTHRIDTALTRLGFSPRHRTCPIDQLSGGWRNRAALAHLLLEAPEVLLLDEPTNYLDLDGMAWLEEFLLKQKGALVLVSHDRHFLNAVVTRIVEIENYHLQEYAGDYTAYVRQKPLRMKTLERQFQYEEELLAYEVEAITDRREDARNPAQALRRRLANIKKQLEPRPVDAILTNLYAGLQTGMVQCRAEALSKAYPGQTLFTDLSFELRKGERLVLLGANGCGKSTLLRALVQAEDTLPELSALDHGRVVWSGKMPFADFSQVFADLDLDDSVTHAVNVTPLAYIHPRKKVHQFLELMQFSELDLTKRIGALSGGQKARMALALCLLSGAGTILLDEPTNHLDLTSAQVMERALLHFPGAVIAASHDRFFIDKVATRLLLFEGNGRTRLYEGNWTMLNASPVDQR